jgi:hypothetical protein
LANNDAVNIFERAVGQLGAVGTHVGDKTGGAAAHINTFIEFLGNRHGALGGKAQLARGFLLQGAGNKGCRRRALDLTFFYVAYNIVGVL